MQSFAGSTAAHRMAASFTDGDGTTIFSAAY
jgi:hypothetical protein